MPPLSAGYIHPVQSWYAFVVSLRAFTTARIALLTCLAFCVTSCALQAQGATHFRASATKAGGEHIKVSATLPAATVGTSYNAVVSVNGGAAPYQFSIGWGMFPPGLTLNARTGTISGAPLTSGSYSFAVFARDLPNADHGDHRFTIVVAAPSSSGSNVRVTISPTSASVPSGGTQQFTATVSETSNAGVTWSASAGTISKSGLFMAPTSTVATTVTATATSLADPTKQASATVSVTATATAPPPPPPPSPSPNPAPSGADNRYCNPGDVANFGDSDGPATLPQRCINTAMANTPSPGKTILVPAGGDVNTTLNNASCGDTILLQAGATFQGPVVLPAKNCDAQNWITLRTSAPDSSLPPEGTRVTPCYAGVSSLPDRPAYSCPAPQEVLATIQIRNGAGAITVAGGANYYRIVGLEVTRQAGTGTAYGLVKMAAADHLIFDRVWIHGTPLDETTRGIYLGDSTNVAVIDSYFNDFHCIAITGTCTDAQTINGGNSLVPNGPYKIVNNFLEAAAENVLFGGAGGSTIPGDIEIRRNHMFKPISWMPGSSNFIGTKFIAKNLFELKNAERLLFEGNVMENSWGGFSQVGWGIVFTPRGTWAAVQDITVRYNTIRHVGSGFQIAATQVLTLNGTHVDSLAAQRLSIHDVTVDDMNASTYNGAGIGFMISSAFSVNPPLNNLTINHVTMFTDPNKSLLIVGANVNNPALPSNIKFTNNIAVAGAYSVWTTGVPVTGGCAKSGQPLITFNQCWSSYTVDHNALVAYPSNQGPWPAGNYFPTTDTAVGFTSFNNADGGNYQLLSSSPYKNIGSDGKDLGADVDAISTTTAGVY